MNIATVISMLIFAQAPADVPKDHWAFPAVHALFKEGLLKGYPSGKQPPLKLDKSVKQDLKHAEKVLTVWKAEGFLVGYPSGYTHRKEVSNYELAVAIHAAWSNVKGMLEDTEVSEEKRKVVRKWLPEITKMISMFEPELTQLGASPKEMISALNILNDSPHRQFHGERR